VAVGDVLGFLSQMLADEGIVEAELVGEDAPGAAAW
jgi:hypothetical protein